MLKNKFSILVPVYNNDEFLRPCLESITDFAHELVILEGGWNPALSMRSTDNTLSIVEEFRQRYDKIRVVYYNAIEGEDHRTNTYNPTVLFNQIRAKQQAVKDLTGDWMMMVDSDEIYRPEDLIKLDNYLYNLKVTEEYFVCRIPAFVFYFDYWFGTREYFTRISRILESPCQLTWEDSVLPPKNRAINQMDLDPDLILMYHYGYPTLSRVRNKLKMWRGDVTDVWFKEYENIMNDKMSSKKSGKTFYKPGQNYHLFAKSLGYGQAFEYFTGTHPECMKGIVNI